MRNPTAQERLAALPRDSAGHETRSFRARIHVRAANDDGSIPFRGHAAVFGQRTWINDFWGGFFEELEAGAFRDVLDNDVRHLINHDPNFVLARTTNGTLRLSEDADGLVNEADMAPTQYARDLAITLERGDVDQQSFAFEVGPDGERWEKTDDGADLRVITRVSRLWDTSVVTYPAYASTDAGLRGERLAVLTRALGFDRLATPRRDALIGALARGELDAEDTQLVTQACERLGALARCDRAPQLSEREQRRREQRRLELAQITRGGV